MQNARQRRGGYLFIGPVQAFWRSLTVEKVICILHYSNRCALFPSYSIAHFPNPLYSLQEHGKRTHRRHARRRRLSCEDQKQCNRQFLQTPEKATHKSILPRSAALCVRAGTLEHSTYEIIYAPIRMSGLSFARCVEKLSTDNTTAKPMNNFTAAKRNSSAEVDSKMAGIGAAADALLERQTSDGTFEAKLVGFALNHFEKKSLRSAMPQQRMMLRERDERQIFKIWPGRHLGKRMQSAVPRPR